MSEELKVIKEEIQILKTTLLGLDNMRNYMSDPQYICSPDIKKEWIESLSSPKRHIRQQIDQLRIRYVEQLEREENWRYENDK